MRISESVMWVLLALGAVFGAVFIGWETHSQWQSLPAAEQQAVLSQEEVQNIAQDFVRNHFTVDTTSYQATAVLLTAALPLTFLEQSYLPESERAVYRDTHLGASTVYFVRFFIPEQIEEYVVTIDAYRGTIVDFSQTLPEDTVITEVSEVEAIDAATQFVASQTRVTADALRVLAREEKTYPGGIERLVTFAWQGSEVDSEYGQGFVTFETAVRGTTVTTFTRSFEYPESYERAIEKSANLGALVGFVSLLAWVIVIVAALVVMIRSFTKGTALWKLSLGVVSVLAGLLLIDFINTYPETLAWYSTIDSLSVYILFSLVFAALGIVLTAVMFFVPSVAGFTIAAEKYRERIDPLLSLPKTSVIKTSYRLALVRGYLLGILFLGFTFALYWVGETYLGVWYPLEEAVGLDGLGSFVPAFSLMLYFGIMAAILEEITFRLFGILWISAIAKSTLIGVLVATVIWAFAHTDGTVLPVWFRGAEVFAGGLLFAYFFIRYNILTTIVAHYVHNIILAGILLFFTFGTAQLLPVLLIFAMPALVYFGFELVVNKRRV